MAQAAYKIDPDDIARVIMLAFGQMDNGGSYWCYVAVKPSRFDEFRYAMASKAYNMQHYAVDGFGEVIVSGEGATPPSDITKQVADAFGVPIRQLFADTDPKQAIAVRVAELKKLQENQN